jgi:AcrR family transcriptional regulator
MPYEVVKRISGRAYRYQVESYRDPDTGRVRNRWTYLGKVVDGETDRPPVRRKAPAETRQRIIDAFLKLVDTQPWNAVTPGAVATEAGIAHGTFYRHFHNREDLLDACAADAFNALDARLHELMAIADTVEEERRRLRAWVIDFLRRPTAPAGLMRVIIESLSDERSGRIRLERRTVRINAFADYITALRDRGYSSATGEVRPLASALSLIVEMLARRTILDHALISEHDFAGAVETFDRIIFWRPPEQG